MKSALKHLKCSREFLHILDFWMWVPHPPHGKEETHAHIGNWVNGVQGMSTEIAGKASFLCAAGESERGAPWEWAVLTPGQDRDGHLPTC